MLELIGQNGAITGLTQEVAEALTKEQRQGIIFGSKCLLAGWCLYVTLIWCLKACMLFLLGRITINLRQRRLVQLTAWTCGAAYIATIIVILARCTPIHKTWQILPIPSGQYCTQANPMRREENQTLTTAQMRVPRTFPTTMPSSLRT